VGKVWAVGRGLGDGDGVRRVGNVYVVHVIPFV
jgi:hypothetical protein